MKPTHLVSYNNGIFSLIRGVLFLLMMIVLVNFVRVRGEIVTLEKEVHGLKTQIRELSSSDYVHATVTAYSARRAETDHTPHITACQETIKRGSVAVSRDLFLHGWTFGKKIYIYQHGVFTIADLMNARFHNSVDIFMPCTQDALKFGKKEGVFVCLLD